MKYLTLNTSLKSLNTVLYFICSLEKSVFEFYYLNNNLNNDEIIQLSFDEHHYSVTNLYKI